MLDVESTSAAFYGARVRDAIQKPHGGIKTYRVQVHIASKGIHVQYEAVVGQIHGEPNAEEANSDTSQVARLEQIEEILRVLFLGWRFQHGLVTAG